MDHHTFINIGGTEGDTVVLPFWCPFLLESYQSLSSFRLVCTWPTGWWLRKVPSAAHCLSISTHLPYEVTLWDSQAQGSSILISQRVTEELSGL